MVITAGSKGKAESKGITKAARPKPVVKKASSVMKQGNEDMPDWNQIRWLKYDDGMRSACECGWLYVHHMLEQQDSGEDQDPTHMHAGAVRELLSSSRWSPQIILAELKLFFSTYAYDDDPRVDIREPDDDMHGAPVLIWAVEEMAVSDGSLKKARKADKLQLLEMLMSHGADWHQVNTCEDAQENHSALDAALLHYPELADELGLEALAGPPPELSENEYESECESESE